jgi:hypothetical protein
VDKLVQASLTGYSDCDFELSKAYKYLAEIHVEAMSLKKAALS